MANALYRKGPDNVWFNQANPGGPALMYVNSPDGSTWTYNLEWPGELIWSSPAHVATQAQAQTNLDNYAAQLNAGTA